MAVGICLMAMIAIAPSGMAQEDVHQILQQIGPGQSKGSATAPVLVEEFSDFQCGYCGKFARETLPRLMATYVETGKVWWVFRHFAILGPNFQAAAEASACAGAQKPFWPYHDRLYEVQGQRAFTRENLRRVAEDLQLDLAQFSDRLDSRGFSTQVQAETQAAIALGLRGTPGFVIHGRAMAGALPFELFQSAIDEALVAASSGVSPVPQTGQPDTQTPSR